MCVCMSVEVLNNVTLDLTKDVIISNQTVEFVVQLSRPNFVTKWLKDGFPIVNNDKYQIWFEDEGQLHLMTINNVTDADEGVYTFKVNHRRASLNLSLTGTSFERFLIKSSEKSFGDDDVFF